MIPPTPVAEKDKKQETAKERRDQWLNNKRSTSRNEPGTVGPLSFRWVIYRLLSSTASEVYRVRPERWAIPHRKYRRLRKKQGRYQREKDEPYRQ